MRLEHIGPLGHDRWEELRDGEEDPFRAEDLSIRWRSKDLYTVLFDGDRPVSMSGWSSRRPTPSRSSAWATCS